MEKHQKEVLQAQLNSEKELIKELKHIFGQAQDDCVNKIIDLARRKDMENLQTIIYQKQYQEVLKNQLDTILDNLQTNEYSSISEYLTKCYEEGFIGAMYDIAAQGVPLIIPIDQEQVVKAIQIDSKLSEKYYKADPLKGRLGEDITELKKAVRLEVSRGIANGSSWLNVGEQLAKSMKHTPFQKAFNDSVRIAKTEGHRIQVQSAMDAQKKAKAAGADIVKQWDATLDGRTRHTHRLLDGQIRELDEPFEVQGTKVDAPGMFGDPAEDCNCRCALLQRARWALDDDELQALREKAAFHGTLVDDSKEYGHEKAKDFADYKNKYRQASERVRSGSQKINTGYTEDGIVVNNITKAIIDAVKLKPISDINADELKVLEDAHKKVLNVAMTENASKEVAIMLDNVMKEIGNPILGTATDIDLNVPGRSKAKYFIHNHPNNASFSNKDIIWLLINDNVKYFSIVKNNGKIEMLIKTKDFDKNKLRMEYKRLEKKYSKDIENNEQKGYSKVIKDLLQKTKSGLYYER